MGQKLKVEPGGKERKVGGEEEEGSGGSIRSVGPN